MEKAEIGQEEFRELKGRVEARKIMLEIIERLKKMEKRRRGWRRQKSSSSQHQIRKGNV